MVKRICPKCNIVFNQKGHYDYHINRKYECNLNNNLLIDLNDEKTENLNICKNLQEFTKICNNEKIVQKNNEIFIKLNNSNILKSDLSNLTEINNLSTNTNDTSFCCSFCNKKYF